MRIGLLVLIGALGLSIQSLGNAQVPAPGVSANDLALLISDAKSESARGAAQRLLLAAEAGNSFAMYDIGSLARQPQRKASAALAYDPGLALQWLVRAFDEGRLTAAYKLALIYRDIGDTLEAMAWAQVYGHYTKTNAKADGIIASLIANLYQNLAKDQAESIRLRTIALLQLHGPRFETSKKRDRNPAHLGDIVTVENCVFPKRVPRGLWEKGRLRESALIEALVQLDAEGKPRQIHLLDFSRKALNAERTHRLVSTLRCPPNTSAESRWMFANIRLDDRRYSLALP